MDPYLQYMQDHPPRCIASCAAVPSDEMESIARGAYGAYTTVFQIGGNDGRQEWPVWGHVESGHPMRSSPILVGSSQVDDAVFVFDEMRDGYNGEFDLAFGPDETAGPPTEVSCPECGTNLLSLTAVFQYSGDNEELDEDDLIARRQDFFAWFALLARCSKCPWKGVIADIECA